LATAVWLKTAVGFSD